MRRITILVVVAMVTSLAAAATIARAAAPTQDWVDIDETFTWDDCGFAVEEHDVLTLHFIMWTDASGNPTRRLVTAPGARVTYTNPATGASVTSPNPFVAHRTYNADGSFTVATTGLVFSIHGGGKAYVDSGRFVFRFANGALTPITDSGPSADLCEALTAAIG